MGKYLLLWNLDPARIPVDPKERGTGWGVLMEMVKNDLEKGIMKGKRVANPPFPL